MGKTQKWLKAHHLGLIVTGALLLYASVKIIAFFLLEDFMVAGIAKVTDNPIVLVGSIIILAVLFTFFLKKGGKR